MKPIKFSEALRSIEDNYVIGAVRYFSNLDPNPWNTACDRVDQYMIGKTAEELSEPSLAYAQYRDEIIKLIDQFKTTGNSHKRIADYADAFMCSSQEKISSHDSLVEKKCAECDEVNNLSIKRVGTTETKLVCKNHTSEGLWISQEK